jgi:hypothetical protein
LSVNLNQRHLQQIVNYTIRRHGQLKIPYSPHMLTLRIDRTISSIANSLYALEPAANVPDHKVLLLRSIYWFICRWYTSARWDSRCVSRTLHRIYVSFHMFLLCNITRKYTRTLHMIFANRIGCFCSTLSDVGADLAFLSQTKAPNMVEKQDPVATTISSKLTRNPGRNLPNP